MKYRSPRMRKPDPLLLLALIVGLGVVVTTAAQAAGPGEQRAARADSLYAVGTHLLLDPRTGLAERIAPLWVNNLLERPALRQLIETRGGVGRPFGVRGPELTLSLRPAPVSTAAKNADSAGGAVPEWRPDLYINLTRHW
ncbi:MAG: hypothetical protein K8I04_10445 [Gammaproteobacteria bacterium]|nr:hypothetical protein [Gammaproteobacteria bacterium]